MQYTYLNIKLIHITSVFILLIFKFRTPNVCKNYFIYTLLMVCFPMYLYNTPMFAQSSLRQGTI